ncbi:MAG: hypothetical protein ACJ76H_00475 [Bacteriovoracaceae bacterium]
MRLLVFLGVLVFSFSAFSLEVDEKLTVRILKTSESRKTVMLNRGTEDGLVEGDHARFLVTAGIVARAVCVKVAPTRSVWSIYRLVNADFLVNDSVMTIKITPPVKITKDESQALVQEDTPTKLPADPQAVGIPLAEGAQDISANAGGEENVMDGDLRGLEDVTIVEKNVEVFSFLSISGLTSQTKSDVGDKKFSNSQSFHHIGIGGELYSRREREWYSRFSLLGSVSFIRTNSQAYNGFAATNDVTEFSVGTNWHPGTMPSATYRFIPFANLMFNIGSVRSSASGGVNTNGEDISANGSTTGFSLGGGLKYYTKEGFGARAILDYYVRNEKFKRDEQNFSFNRTTAGPRFMVGLSYRF